MTELIHIHNKIITVLLAFLITFLVATVTYAQTPPASSLEDAAVKYGVTFPIAELGNCEDYYTCRAFCEDPINAAACTDYGKQRGFYQDDLVVLKDEGILDDAEKDLGCDSYGTCKSFCEIPENYDECDGFAKDQGLIGGHVGDPRAESVMEKAREVLGCDSYSSCAAFCTDDANRSKCSTFAQEVGLKGGETSVGPGGCASEGTCKAFCSIPENYSVCSGFSQAVGSTFTGPGGCNSADSCKSYCESNADACAPKVAGAAVSIPKYDPSEMCNRTPACSWKNNTCVCSSFGGSGDSQTEKRRAEEYGKFCSENPQKCSPGGVGGFESREDRASFERYCRENPQGCRPTNMGITGGSSYDPAIQCSKYSGCAWTGNSCQCSTKYASAASLGETNPEQSCTQGGCKWSGNGCDCSTSTADSPALACGRQTGCSWTNSTCQCSYYPYPTPVDSGKCQPGQYIGPGGYCIFQGPYSYPTPYNYSYPTPYTYSYPTPGGTYSYPTPYSYQTPYVYSYPTPGGTYPYPTPYGGNYPYPTPYGGNYPYPTPYVSGPYPYPTPYQYSYPSPQVYSYPTPTAPEPYSYPTPQQYSYPTPQQYSYPTPEAYSYPSPYSYPTPNVQGVSTTNTPNWWEPWLELFGF